VSGSLLVITRSASDEAIDSSRAARVQRNPFAAKAPPILTSTLCTSLGGEFFSHDTVNHGAEEYMRDDVGTNTVEGFNSIFKRGMKGVYQHCNEKHLHRYLCEFDFCYSNRIALGIDDVGPRREGPQGRSWQAIKVQNN
jgi:hypothetical protein